MAAGCKLAWPWCGLNRAFLPAQRAMNLSAAQKLSLRDWRKRAMLESAQALQRRAGLLQRLSCQMVGDDARSMERVTMVRASPALTRSRPQQMAPHREHLSCTLLTTGRRAGKQVWWASWLVFSCNRVERLLHRPQSVARK